MPHRPPVQGSARLTLTVTVQTAKGPKETEYLLHYLHPYPEADPAWRLTKLKDGEPSDVVYDVALTPSGPECSCPDWNWCRQNAEKSCKHAESLRAVGLLRRGSDACHP